MRKIFGLAMMLTSSLTVFSATAAGAPKELNLGILGGQNATQQIGDNQCVKQFLDKELGGETRLRNASDYSGVIQGLLGGKVDLVLSMSPSAFASVYLKDPNAVDIVGIAVDDKDLSRGYHSVVVVVKADSPYKKLEDLKGKSFGFADPDSTSGFLVPNQIFKQKFGGNNDNKYNNFFSSVTFSGGHEQDILGVLNGQFDGAVAWTSMVGDYTHGLYRRRFYPPDSYGPSEPDAADPDYLAIPAESERPDSGQQQAACGFQTEGYYCGDEAG